MSKIPKKSVRFCFCFKDRIGLVETILFFEKMQYNYSFALSDSIICIRLNMESLNNPGPFSSMIIPNTMRSNCQRGFTWI